MQPDANCRQSAASSAPINVVAAQRRACAARVGAPTSCAAIWSAVARGARRAVANGKGNELLHASAQLGALAQLATYILLHVGESWLWRGVCAAATAGTSGHASHNVVVCSVGIWHSIEVNRDEF